MAHVEIIPHNSNDDAAAAHAIASITVESEGESRPWRIRLPYQDVHKFRNDGLEAGKIPKMPWKMLQELGYEKQPEYFGTRVTYEGSETVWHVQVYKYRKANLYTYLTCQISWQTIITDQYAIYSVSTTRRFIPWAWSSTNAGTSFQWRHPQQMPTYINYVLHWC
jgi:hypothetical protein